MYIFHFIAPVRCGSCKFLGWALSKLSTLESCSPVVAADSANTHLSCFDGTITYCLGSFSIGQVVGSSDWLLDFSSSHISVVILLFSLLCLRLVHLFFQCWSCFVVEPACQVKVLKLNSLWILTIDMMLSEIKRNHSYWYLMVLLHFYYKYKYLHT